MQQHNVLHRNNTNFALYMFEHLRKLDISDEYEFLHYYQNIVREYFRERKGTPNIFGSSRGLLIMHTMGMGKTITAISIAMDSAVDTGRQVIVLLTKSLQSNFRESIKKYVLWRTSVDKFYKLGLLSEEDLNRWINKHFSFVSMNASNMLAQMSRAVEGEFAQVLDKASKRIIKKKISSISTLNTKIDQVVAIGSLDNKMLIVDEAHNLFRAIVNGSKNARELYDMVMRANNLHLVFLTGTPISSDPFELVPCFNMLGDTSGKPILPETYKEFYNLYVDTETSTVKNKEKFQNRLFGLVSFVDHNSKPGLMSGRTEDPVRVEFPEQKETIIEHVPMLPEQYVVYQLARDKEMSESQRGQYFNPMRIRNIPSLQKPKSDFTSSYRVASRQLSNYCPPEKFRDMKFSNINVYDLPENTVVSPKLEAILRNVEKSPGLGIVYSQFIGVGGLGILARYLELHGWEQMHVTAEKVMLEKALAKETTPEEYVSEDFLDIDEDNEVTGNSESIVVRDMIEVDIDELQRIDEEKNINIGKNYKQIMIQPFSTYVALIEEDIAGYITVEETTCGIFIKNIDVATEYKHLDVADELFMHVCNEYKELFVVLNKKCPFYHDDLSFYTKYELRLMKDTDTLTYLRTIPIGPLDKTGALDEYNEIDDFMQKNYGITTSSLDITGGKNRRRNKPRVKHQFDNTIYCFAIDHEEFRNIERGIKTVKESLYLGKITNVKPGDLIIFNDKLTTEVTLVKKYDSFAEMLNKENVDSILSGLPTIKQALNYYKKNYSMDDEKMHGVIAIHIIIKDSEIPALRSKVFIGGGNNRKFAIISGNVDVDDRKALQNIFNSDDNMRGGVLDLILLSSTGAEGLDFKNIRHIHIMEPYWNHARLMQIIGRGVRDNSHKKLNADERNVQPYIYLAIRPKEWSGVEDQQPKNRREIEVATTDVELYTESIKAQALINDFLTTLKEVSIECMLNGGEHCRVCNPDNTLLFTEDYINDLRTSNPCQPIIEKKITAKEVVVDGVKYYYTPDPSSIYEYKIYEYDESISGYKQIPEDISIFQHIIKFL